MENQIDTIQKYLHNGRAEDMDNRIEKLRKYIDDILQRGHAGGNCLND